MAWKHKQLQQRQPHTSKTGGAHEQYKNHSSTETPATAAQPICSKMPFAEPSINFSGAANKRTPAENMTDAI